MFRKNYLGVTVLAMGLVMTASVPGYAKLMPRGLPQPSLGGFGGFGHSLWPKELRMNSLHATLPDTVLLGTSLPAGEYTISWKSRRATAKVTISRKSDILATVEGKLVKGAKKHDSSVILFGKNAEGKRTIREIHLGGSSQAIVFYE